MGIVKRRDPTEILRYTLAARMVAHEARTRTIQRWSGVSAGRIRELYRAHADENGGCPVRHRGPPPSQVAFFLQTARRRSESAALAALCSVLGVMPTHPPVNVKKDLPNFRRGALLVQAYEAYRSLVGSTDFTLEHAVLLVTELVQGTELALGHCLHCGGVIVLDPRDPRRRACAGCRREGEGRPEKAPAPARQGAVVPESESRQQTLI